MPAVALSVPPTDKSDFMVKFLAVVIVPVILNALKVSVPVPAMVFDAPIRLTVPAVEVNVPFTVMSLAITKETAVLTVPYTIKLLNEMPVPLIVLPLPLIVKVPAAPASCENVPPPLVAKFPATVRLEDVAAVNPTPVIVRLLKSFRPVPLMDLFIPRSVTELVLPVKVPLFVQFPPMM